MSGGPRGAGKEDRIEPRVADLRAANDWPYDEPFLGRLGPVMRAAGQTVACVNPLRLGETFARLQRGDLQARAFLDRAVNSDAAFEPLEAWAAEHVPRVLHPASDRRRV